MVLIVAPLGSAARVSAGGVHQPLNSRRSSNDRCHRTASTNVSPGSSSARLPCRHPSHRPPGPHRSGRWLACSTARRRSRRSAGQPGARMVWTGNPARPCCLRPMPAMAKDVGQVCWCSVPPSVVEHLVSRDRCPNTGISRCARPRTSANSPGRAREGDRCGRMRGSAISCRVQVSPR